MDTVSMSGPSGRKIEELLGLVYGERTPEALRLVREAIGRHLPFLPGTASAMASGSPPAAGRFTEKDALLITYGDMIAPGSGGPAESALARLGGFIGRRLAGLFTYMHLLPFYPSSSDDGFSVMDYRAVDPALGSWSDIEALGRRGRLAFDLVLNHASARGVWFQAFKAGRPPFDRFFLTRPLDYDYSAVLRPRTHRLITPARLDDGRTAGVWTTFSADQADLDFSEPAVLAEFIDIILFYAERGARMLRLDAIAYLWKRDGTSCAHLPETHAIVKTIRAALEALGLDMAVLTETNVPHEENMSYFGDADEAHLVYNFSLPPLTLHAFATGDAGPLSRWAASLRVPTGGTMLNFLASHDGIGVTPTRGLVSGFGRTIDAVQARGGLVSYKSTPAGAVPYELNVSWADAVARPGADADERSRALAASYAVACAMDGVPAVYFHSMVGSGNWIDGPALLGYNRAINRQRPALDRLEAELDDPLSMRARSMAGLASLLRERALRPAFAPSAPRKAYPADGPVFAVERGDGDGAVLVVINCQAGAARFRLPEGWSGARAALDPVAGKRTALATERGRLSMPGYGVLWIERRPAP